MAGGSPFPVRVPVILERVVAGTVDELGNVSPAWAESEEVMVVGIEPAVSTEPLTVGPNRVVVDAKMYAPTELGIGPDDRVTAAGTRFDVVGYPGRADLGPWWDLPLSTVLLKAVEG